MSPCLVLAVLQHLLCKLYLVIVLLMLETDMIRQRISVDIHWWILAESEHGYEVLSAPPNRDLPFWISEEICLQGEYPRISAIRLHRYPPTKVIICGCTDIRYLPGGYSPCGYIRGYPRPQIIHQVDGASGAYPHPFQAWSCYSTCFGYFLSWKHSSRLRSTQMQKLMKL